MQIKLGVVSLSFSFCNQNETQVNSNDSTEIFLSFSLNSQRHFCLDIFKIFALKLDCSFLWLSQGQGFIVNWNVCWRTTTPYWINLIIVEYYWWIAIVHKNKIYQISVVRRVTRKMTRSCVACCPPWPASTDSLYTPTSIQESIRSSLGVQWKLFRPPG